MVIVSAYFKIPSKQPHSFYQGHLRRFFNSIRESLVFFTTADLYQEFISYGYNLSHINFQIIEFSDLVAWKKFGPDFWKRQTLRDPEKYHTPEVAAFWFEKKEFILKTMDLLPNETIFIWCDSGCIRDNASELAAKNFGTRKDLNNGKLHLQCISDTPVKQPFYVYPHAYIAGAIQVGNRNAWLSHSILYDSVVIEYDTATVSCNSDQYVIHSCINKQPNFYEIHHNNTNINPWFFFLAYV